MRWMRFSIIASNAFFIVGYSNTILALMTRDDLTRNHGFADKLGVLTGAGLNDMPRGFSPTIKRGPYVDGELSVDHVVPFGVAPELDTVIANLELKRLRMNQPKNDKIGTRQGDCALKFYKARLLTKQRLDEIAHRKLLPKS